jgi:hypothetical protein
LISVTILWNVCIINPSFRNGYNELRLVKQQFPLVSSRFVSLCKVALRISDPTSIVHHISAQLQKGCTVQEYTHSSLYASAVSKHAAETKNFTSSYNLRQI